MAKRVLVIMQKDGTRLNQHHIEAMEAIGMDILVATDLKQADEMIDCGPQVVVSDGRVGFDKERPMTCLHRRLRQKNQGVTLVVIGEYPAIGHDMWGNLRDDPNCITLYPWSADVAPTRLAERTARLAVTG